MHVAVSVATRRCICWFLLLFYDITLVLTITNMIISTSDVYKIIFFFFQLLYSVNNADCDIHFCFLDEKPFLNATPFGVKNTKQRHRLWPWPSSYKKASRVLQPAGVVISPIDVISYLPCPPSIHHLSSDLVTVKPVNNRTRHLTTNELLLASFHD